MTIDLDRLTITDAARLIARRRLSPVDLIEATLGRIQRLNPALNALLSVSAESARAAAQRAEKIQRRKGALPPLLGIPLSVKDLILTADAPTTLGSRIVPEGIPAGEDAPVVRRLKRGGGVVVGKANLHEVAFGVTSDNEHFGPARNPWLRDRIPGGSSGGSAVAVAAGLGLGSVGTDTRGSIRIPAACCGVVGLKPTFGAVDSDGVFPLAATLDHVGPLARSVEDAALLFSVMASSRAAGARALASVKRPRRPRVAVAEFFLRDLDDEIGKAIERTLRALQRQGVRVSSVTLPALEESLEASRVIVGAEALSYHDPFLRERPEGYGPLVRSRLETGYQLTALQLVRAEETRLRLAAEFEALFRSTDCLIGAVIPILPPPIGTLVAKFGSREVSLAEAFCHFNAPANLTGLPSLSVPCGVSRTGLPIGLQITAASGRDEVVLATGALVERTDGGPWFPPPG